MFSSLTSSSVHSVQTDQSWNVHRHRRHCARYHLDHWLDKLPKLCHNPEQLRMQCIATCIATLHSGMLSQAPAPPALLLLCWISHPYKWWERKEALALLFCFLKPTAKSDCFPLCLNSLKNVLLLNTTVTLLTANYSLTKIQHQPSDYHRIFTKQIKNVLV